MPGTGSHHVIRSKTDAVNATGLLASNHDGGGCGDDGMDKTKIVVAGGNVSVSGGGGNHGAGKGGGKHSNNVLMRTSNSHPQLRYTFTSSSNHNNNNSATVNDSVDTSESTDEVSPLALLCSAKL